MSTWINRTAVSGLRNGTNSHTFSFTPASAGNLLVAVGQGAVTFTTPSGWTLPANGSAINNSGLYVWYKTASAGESSFTTTHNGTNYPAVAVIYEFAAGSTFVSSASATNLSSSGPHNTPTLSGLTGINHLFGASALAVSGGGTTQTWSAPAGIIEDFDQTVSGGPTDGYALSIAYVPDSSATSFAGTATPADTVNTFEALSFAVKIASSQLITTFTGTDGAAWPAPWTTSSGTATILSNRGRQVTPATQWSDSVSKANRTFTDGRITATVRFSTATGTSMRIAGRFNDSTGNGYRLIMTPEYNGLQLMIVNAWSETALAEAFNVTWATNTDYKVILEIIGSTIRAKVWDASLAEPGTWNHTVTNTTYTTGDVSLTTVTTLASATTGLWDDVIIDDNPVSVPVLSQSDAYRVGFHNDAFLASTDDWGTFSTFTTYDVPTMKTWLGSNTGAVPMGGESANVNSPRSDFASASADLAAYHWTFLNPEYHAGVLSSWGQSGQDEVAKRLGYRLRLQSATLSTLVGANAPVNISLVFINDGYSAPYRNRQAQLIFSGAADHVRNLSMDVRTLTPGTNTVNETVLAPSVPGNYSVHLKFPDQTRTEPAYAIQLANTGVWDSVNGRNTLGHTVQVLTAGPPAGYDTMLVKM